MVNFKIDVCPHCGRKRPLMLSNNPLSGTTICFDCINTQLDSNNLEHAEFFCRTYNLPWQPELWINLLKTKDPSIFQTYTSLVLDDTNNKPNLAYTSTTKDEYPMDDRYLTPYANGDRTEILSTNIIMRTLVLWE